MQQNVLQIICETLPVEIQSYLKDARVSIVKDKKRSSVYHIENQNTLFLKITPKGQMHDEAIMTEYLYKYGLCPKVLIYFQNKENDYLITEQITGRNAASAEYLEQPERVCDVFAESLSRLHNTKFERCPRDNGLNKMINLAKENYMMGKVDRGLLRYLGYENMDEAYKEMISLFGNCDDAVIIHGDYCLPNLILNEFSFSGLVDVGYGGIGDRHYDLFWGIWSLQHNLRSNKYTQRFIDAYGRHQVDDKRLRLCGILSAINGFRGQDYYE